MKSLKDILEGKVVNDYDKLVDAYMKEFKKYDKSSMYDIADAIGEAFYNVFGKDIKDIAAKSNVKTKNDYADFVQHQLYGRSLR